MTKTAPKASIVQVFGLTLLALTLIIFVLLGLSDAKAAISEDYAMFAALGVTLFTSVLCGVVVFLFRRKMVADRFAANETAIDLREQVLNEHTIVNVTDPEGRILEVNENFTETFGFAPEEVIGRSPALLYRGVETSAEFETIRNIVANGGAWSGRQRLLTKDGKSVVVQTSIIPRFDEMGQLRDTVTIRTDLSGALAESAEEGRNSLVEVLQDGVFIYDADSRKLSFANEAGRRRLGWSFEEVKGTFVGNAFPKEDLPMFERYLAPLLDGEAGRVAIELDHDSGPIEILTHLVDNLDGKRSLVSVVRDISERRKAEQLKLSSVSTVSHELRTPLTSIKGALRLLDSGILGELNAEASRMISVAYRNSERLLVIVNDILTLEKLHSGDMAISAEAVDLRNILNDAAEANAPFAAECQVRFAVETTHHPAIVNADPDRLMQVMANLMSNAAKFSPVGSGITLRIEDRGNVWRVCVEDQGPGIPDEAKETLFDSFIQVKNMDSKALPSTGLGLTICREIVQRHGGRIAFETELGKGTTFYFELGKHSDEISSPRMSAVA